MYNYTKPSVKSITIGDYVRLTKPKIVILLALTGAVAYMIASSNTIQPAGLIIYLLVGYFAAGGAMVINNAIDYDIDAKMRRTQDRVSTGKMSRTHVVVFGAFLMVMGIGLGYFYFGKYTALYLSWGSLFYIFGYSLLLKRTTWLNTIIGGLASPAPVWAGFAARYEIEGVISEDSFLGLNLLGFLLGILVFLWTPSHTWTMAVKNIEDYQDAEIPMLPVLIGIRKTSVLTLILGNFVIIYGLWLASIVGTINIIAVFAVSCVFEYYLIRFFRSPLQSEGRVNFVVHNIWLAIVFLVFLL